MITLIQILQVLVHVMWWILIVQFILSVLIGFNVINTYNEFVRSLTTGLDRITEPLYQPIRRFLPAHSQIDFAPLVFVVVLIILDIVLGNVANNLRYGTPL